VFRGAVSAVSLTAGWSGQGKDIKALPMKCLFDTSISKNTDSSRP
jgi:hypothetical protein